MSQSVSPTISSLRVETGSHRVAHDPKVRASRQRARRAMLVAEGQKCREDVRYFTERYCKLYNATAQAWLPFTLWPAQKATLDCMCAERLLVILKARQLGLSWLCLAYALWLMTLHGPATVLIFSMRATEAEELLGRLRGMHARLPRWLQGGQVIQAGAARWELSHGSCALAFSTRSGRSYTGTLAIVDEADYVPDLGRFLSGVKPTIDAGGRLFLVSTSDKRRPVSTFKRLFRAALAGTGDYQPLFLDWRARPDRDGVWRARTQAEMFAQRGSNDDFYAEYPATTEEALAPEQLDRRLPLAWVQQAFAAQAPLHPRDAPALPGLAIYATAQTGACYVLGVDPAEGNPHSDPSAITVLEAGQWEEVAGWSGRVEPGILAEIVAQIATYYAHAAVMVERNNHGHSVIYALRQGGQVQILHGEDGRPGWLSNVRGKPLLYTTLADALRGGSLRLHDPVTVEELVSIEASTLRAPAGLHDDKAMSLALAVAALAFGNGNATASVVAPAIDHLAHIDEESAW